VLKQQHFQIMTMPNKRRRNSKRYNC